MSKTLNFIAAATMLLGACTTGPQKREANHLPHPAHRQVAVTQPPKSRLVVSLLPTAAEGEFIAERNVTAISKHPDHVRHEGGLYDYSFKITRLPEDVALAQIPNNLTSEQCMRAVIDSVDAHLKQHGKLNMLEIVGHGRTNVMALGENSPLSTTIDDKKMLKMLLDYQIKNKVQIADTILLGGCGVMGDLYPRDASIYNNFAKRLGSKIEGSTITVSAESFNSKGIAGLYAVFDGSESVSVDTALSHIDYYIKDRSEMGNDSTDYENPRQIEQKSRWMQIFNRSTKLKKRVSRALTLKI